MSRKYFHYFWNFVKREEFFITIEHCLDFSIVFSAPLLEETCFQQARSSVVERSGQVVLGYSDQRKVLASLTLYQKKEKIPDLLYIRKGPKYRPFCNFRPVPLAY
jgi:hypothetical protein